MISSAAEIITEPEASAASVGASAVRTAQRHYRRHVLGRSEIAMEPGSLDVEGLELRYSVTDNASGPEQVWAINIHGYFAGGTMYQRESERLAEGLGWRVVNPNLPGFGGSDPLSWSQISMPSMARRIEALIDHLGLNQVVLLGHSMGGSVAIEFAARYPERVLGIVYRAGVATPAWHQRQGLIPLAMSSIAPDVGPMADLLASVALDVPDLFVGRMLTTIRSVLPDLRRNLKTLARTAPVASMLMELDQTAQVVTVRNAEIPLLAEWGCLDRISNAATAEEFSAIAGVQIHWMPGGHSWMLARPAGQVDILRFLPAGREFLTAVEGRWDLARAASPRLRALG